MYFCTSPSSFVILVAAAPSRALRAAFSQFASSRASCFFMSCSVIALIRSSTTSPRASARPRADARPWSRSCPSRDFSVPSLSLRSPSSLLRCASSLRSAAVVLLSCSSSSVVCWKRSALAFSSSAPSSSHFCRSDRRAVLAAIASSRSRLSASGNPPLKSSWPEPRSAEMARSLSASVLVSSVFVRSSSASLLRSVRMALLCCASISSILLSSTRTSARTPCMPWLPIVLSSSMVCSASACSFSFSARAPASLSISASFASSAVFASSASFCVVVIDMRADLSASTRLRFRSAMVSRSSDSLAAALRVACARASPAAFRSSSTSSRRTSSLSSSRQTCSISTVCAARASSASARAARSRLGLVFAFRFRRRIQDLMGSVAACTLTGLLDRRSGADEATDSFPPAFSSPFSLSLPPACGSFSPSCSPGCSLPCPPASFGFSPLSSAPADAEVETFPSLTALGPLAPTSSSCSSKLRLGSEALASSLAAIFCCCCCRLRALLSMAESSGPSFAICSLAEESRSSRKLLA
mmetsp:Transcript_12808/g.47337  ORF Transcript_12808/g.47337 Transcript_12808/m.47337 type:complete len:528 (-) Transcript_12808:143-1726(-)